MRASKWPLPPSPDLLRAARIVCNSDGDCWHAHEDYAFPPGVRVEVHPDNWRWHEGEHFVWKEHPGRGYWEGREWHNF